MSNSTIIDDTSPDVFYTGHWAPGGISSESNHTTHGTTAEGSQAILSFNGSLIEVFGTIGRENKGNKSFAATSSYTIDNNASETVEFTGEIGTNVLYQQLFFVSQGLAEGEHTLVVSYKTPGKNPLWLDYFRVTHILPASTPTPSSSSSTSGLSTGAIVGISVGACAALALLITIVFLLRSLLRTPPPYTYTNQESTSWLQRLCARLEPKPPGELHPFDPYAQASPYSRSANSFTYPTRSSSLVPGSSRRSSRGMDAVYHYEVTRSNRGRPEDKRSRPSNLTNVLSAETPLPQ